MLKLIKEKGKLFITTEFQLINEEGIMEFKNHHLANTTLIIISDKKHQWKKRW